MRQISVGGNDVHSADDRPDTPFIFAHMNRHIRSFLGLLLGTVSMGTSLNVEAQTDRQRYVEDYKDMAIAEMDRYGIPASITLAQGILESGNGKSRLAVAGRNHFGIKCHNGWDGGRVFHDDDKANECFRKYDKVEDSFRDHSLFLAERSRYAFLFELPMDDYRSWARGLQKAGYATNKKYADLLIRIIEDERLYRFDEVSEGILLDPHEIRRHAVGLRFIQAIRAIHGKVWLQSWTCPWTGCSSTMSAATIGSCRLECSSFFRRKNGNRLGRIIGCRKATICTSFHRRWAFD